MKHYLPRYRKQLRRPALLAWLRIARIFQKIESASAQHFRRYNLSTAQFDVLAQIGAAEGLSQQDLAGSLLVTKGNISQLLKRMEQQGYIRRCQEGRTNALFLTERGRQLFEEVVPAQENLVIDLLHALTPAEQTHLLALLRKLDKGL
jgi:DNA-binding MarR family transcriptional regulator